MSVIINIVAFIAMLLAFTSCTFAKGAIHEIQGLIWLLISVMSFCSATLIDVIKKSQEQKVQS